MQLDIIRNLSIEKIFNQANTTKLTSDSDSPLWDDFNESKIIEIQSLDPELLIVKVRCRTYKNADFAIFIYATSNFDDQ